MGSKQVTEPERVKRWWAKHHFLKRRVTRSHCVALTSSQGVDTGRRKWWQPFLQSMSIMPWKFCHRFVCAYSCPQFILTSCLTAMEVWKRGSLGIWEHQVAHRWSESPVCSPLSLLLPLPWSGFSFLLTRCGRMCQSQKLPRAFDLPQQSWKLLLCLQLRIYIQKWKEEFPGTQGDMSR